MIRVRAYKYYKRATFYFQEFIREHETEIFGADRRNLIVILRNGDELHFVCERDFDRWARGRKYRIEEWERPTAIEELRATAKEMGYKLMPAQPYEKLKACICGGREAKGATEAEARRNWNRMIEEKRRR